MISLIIVSVNKTNVICSVRLKSLSGRGYGEILEKRFVVIYKRQDISYCVDRWQVPGGEGGVIGCSEEIQVFLIA